jgi:hypothetical protein
MSIATAKSAANAEIVKYKTSGFTPIVRTSYLLGQRFAQGRTAEHGVVQTTPLQLPP